MAMNEASVEEEQSRYGIYIDKSEPKDESTVIQDGGLKDKDDGEHVASESNDMEAGRKSRDGEHFFKIYQRPYSERY
jgi:hypothetical protein